MLEQYVRQVRLLLSVLPDIAKEPVFALKGGTAINLSYRDMPWGFCRYRPHLPAGGRPRIVARQH